MTNSALRIGAALVLIVLTIGLANYFIKERPRELPVSEEESVLVVEEAQEEEMTSSSSSASEALLEPAVLPPTETVPEPETEAPITETTASSSSRRIVKKGVSTKKKSGIDVPATLASLQLMTTPTSEKSLLSLSVQGVKVESMILLFNNDRAALFSWIESDDVKTIFSSLKQTLQEQFSPELTGLTDTTQTPPSGPPVDILSFKDPAIAPEIVLFTRVRNRLYEFHIAETGPEVISRLIGELSK